jgi:hypothetical protein
MGAVPDYLEPLRGYRVWHVRHGTELESLCGTAWPPFEHLEARPCMALQAGDVTAGRIACDGAPCVDHWTCGLRCGIYAFSTLDRVLGAIRHESFLLRRSPLVVGEVWLWGRVARHEYGYRAQFAYPAKFIGGLGCDPLHLAIVYGVPYEEETSCTSVCNSVTSWWSHSVIPFPAGPARRPAAAAVARSTPPPVWSGPSRQRPISREARLHRSLSVLWKRRNVVVTRWRAELRRMLTGMRGSRAS